MNENHWVWPERRDLYYACLILADPQTSTARASEAAETLLNDIELYDDPHQGKGTWLFPDELPVADDLAFKLHALAGAETSGDWGHAIIGHPSWPKICADAQHLIELIQHNGQGAARNVR
ncbi:hypothetical protein HT136_00830 [Novosphingobium profundi]|uniref:hypothetical protein n=1 Tax=Novosphingobium profundi TaxID=1774954 RepID=UPI001BD9A6F3|nr:hypothetical protein [Novosphingobium profundi]MBT0666913.1 hypothetical protein [Novosphingobium profundi]